MRPLLPRRRAPVAALAVLTICSGAIPSVQAHAAPVPRWALPVDGPVVRPFEQPVARFGAAHRGVDLAAAPGAPVRAAGEGVVAFAGEVAGALHVVVRHDGGLRTSYSFLASVGVDVRVGDAVAMGDIVGTAGGAGEGHGPGVVHFGLRAGDTYVDPMLLFRPRDLTELVRLVPTSQREPARHPTPDEEADDLSDVFDNTAGGHGCGPLAVVCDAVGDAAGAVADGVDWAGEQVEAALDAGLDFYRQAGEAGIALVEKLDEPLHDLLYEIQHAATEIALRALELNPLYKTLEFTVEIGERLIALWRDCDADAPDADGAGGSGNRVVIAGGIDSSRTTDHSNANGLDWKSLGYERDDVDWFSYEPDSPTYQKEDTYGALLEKAELFGEQLKQVGADHPERALDLIGHSQGGVVILLFLNEVYRGHEDEYPPIDKVITFASPLQGAILAGTGKRLSEFLPADLLLDLFDGLGVAPPHDAESVRGLAPDSDEIRRIASRPPPKGIKVLSLSGAFDLVVSPWMTHAPGATTFTVLSGNVLPFDDHSSILKDTDALRAAHAYLENRQLPCEALVATIAREAGETIADVLLRAGPGAGAPGVWDF